MGQVISEILPFAIGVAIVPVPIIAVILILFSAGTRPNGLAFLFGWVAGLAVAFGVVYALADAGDAATKATASDGVSWLRIALGVLLLLAALRSWRKRPAPGVEAEMPTWMAGIDTLAPGKAPALGTVLAAANPKNLVKASLDEVKAWLVVNNAAVMTALFLVFGGVLIANGLSPLTD